MQFAHTQCSKRSLDGLPPAYNTKCHWRSERFEGANDALGGPIDIHGVPTETNYGLCELRVGQVSGWEEHALLGFSNLPSHDVLWYSFATAEISDFAQIWSPVVSKASTNPQLF